MKPNSRQTMTVNIPKKNLILNSDLAQYETAEKDKENNDQQ
jgi:hypothetical protein